MDQERIGKYMRVVARGYVDDEDVVEDRDEAWEAMNKAERDECNRLVVLVFRDYF